MGAEGVGGTPEELVGVMKADMATAGKLIKDAGIHVE